jgi:hypothetical protein
MSSKSARAAATSAHTRLHLGDLPALRPEGRQEPVLRSFEASAVSDIACPDNITFDDRGNLWIATDGQPGTLGRNDTVFAVPTAGLERGNVQPFLSVPAVAEVCGPEFTPDFQTLFVNVQHPGESNEGPNALQSLWPDGIWPPLPSLVVVTKNGGGRIGS